MCIAIGGLLFLLGSEGIKAPQEGERNLNEKRNVCTRGQDGGILPSVVRGGPNKKHSHLMGGGTAGQGGGQDRVWLTVNRVGGMVLLGKTNRLPYSRLRIRFKNKKAEGGLRGWENGGNA